MADSAQEKTEQPTGKRLGEARDKGQVPKSTEVNSFFALLIGSAIIYLTQKTFGGHFLDFMRDNFSNITIHSIDKDTLRETFVRGVSELALLTLPILIGLVIIGLMTNISQFGLNFSLEAVKPKFSKLNAVKGIKNVFFSQRSFVELLKSLVKMIMVGMIAYPILTKLVEKSTTLTDFQPEEILRFMADSAFAIIWKVSIAFAVLAAIDLWFQRWRYKKELRMSKQEVKEENKQVEGDPLVKSKIKSKQFSLARQRMMKNVPNADVVITNPTHFAVALEYKTGQTGAPRVVAKGVDRVALKIKEVAKEHNVPIYEDKPLARALYKYCDVGDEIPTNLFKAVAQILAYLFKQKNAKKKKSIV